MDICARKEQVVLISYKTFVVLLIVKFWPLQHITLRNENI
jgi:hypothetical protein